MPAYSDRIYSLYLGSPCVAETIDATWPVSEGVEGLKAAMPVWPSLISFRAVDR